MSCYVLCVFLIWNWAFHRKWTEILSLPSLTQKMDLASASFFQLSLHEMKSGERSEADVKADSTVLHLKAMVHWNECGAFGCVILREIWKSTPLDHKGLELLCGNRNHEIRRKSKTFVPHIQTLPEVFSYKTKYIELSSTLKIASLFSRRIEIVWIRNWLQRISFGHHIWCFDEAIGWESCTRGLSSTMKQTLQKYRRIEVQRPCMTNEPS